MKTKEFISKMDNVEGVQNSVASRGIIYVYGFDGAELGEVSIDDFGAVDTSDVAFGAMKNKEEFVKLLFDYALTPLSEREDELKFWVRMLPIKSGFNTYLNQDKRNKGIFLEEPDEINGIQTIFTKSEYDKLQQKYRDWLPKFDEKDPHFEFLKNKNEKENWYDEKEDK